MKTMVNRLPGIGLAALIAVPAWLIGSRIPVVGSPVLGILFGMLLAFWKRPSVFNGGISYTGKKLLQYAIVLIGFDMNLFQIMRVGGQTLLLMAFTLTAAFLGAYIVGRQLKIDRNTNILVGVGTAICGGSAIAATAPVIGAKDEEVARSISTIFLFNVIAAFLFPALGHLMQMSDTHFGLWAGTAINDTSSVVAAGYTFSDAAGALAVIVKLTRTLMIIPVTLVLALYTARTQKGVAGGRYHFSKIFPWFVLGFVAASVISTFLPVPKGAETFMVKLGKYMIVMAMASIGLNTNLIHLVRNGKKPLLLGLCCWVILAGTSLMVQYTLLRTV